MTGNQIAYWNLEEQKRSNRAKETETNRTNLVNEGIKSDTLAETKRSNLIQEGIKRDDVDSQIKRRSVQNGVDITSTVFDGIGTLGKLGTGIAGLFV